MEEDLGFEDSSKNQNLHLEIVIRMPLNEGTALGEKGECLSFLSCLQFRAGDGSALFGHMSFCCSMLEFYRLWITRSNMWHFHLMAEIGYTAMHKGEFRKTIMVCLALWKNRNNIVWNQKGMESVELVESSILYLNQWRNAQDKSFDLGFMTQADGKEHWQRPPEGMIKINTDAALFTDSNIYRLIATRRRLNRGNSNLQARVFESSFGRRTWYTRSFELS